MSVYAILNDCPFYKSNKLWVVAKKQKKQKNN